MGEFCISPCRFTVPLISHKCCHNCNHPVCVDGGSSIINKLSIVSSQKGWDRGRWGHTCTSGCKQLAAYGCARGPFLSFFAVKLQVFWPLVQRPTTGIGPIGQARVALYIASLAGQPLATPTTLPRVTARSSSSSSVHFKYLARAEAGSRGGVRMRNRK